MRCVKQNKNNNNRVLLIALSEMSLEQHPSHAAFKVLTGSLPEALSSGAAHHKFT